MFLCYTKFIRGFLLISAEQSDFALIVNSTAHTLVGYLAMIKIRQNTLLEKVRYLR